MSGNYSSWACAFGLHHILLPLYVCFSRQGLFACVHLRQVGGNDDDKYQRWVGDHSRTGFFFHRVVYRCIHLIYRI